MTSVSDLLVSLESIVRQTGEPLEGNCVYEDKTYTQHSDLIPKQKNLETAAAASNRICEIGFNAGHSALLMLHAAKPGSTFVFFDLGEHTYTAPCASFLQSMFPLQHFHMYYGDSRLTMPRWIQANPGAIASFDFVHVDGGHTSECITSDLQSAYLLTKPGGIIIVDDVHDGMIRRAMNVWMRAGLLQIDRSFEPTLRYPHAVLRKVI